MASAHTVFGIPELFDMIHLELNPRQLFINLRVSRSWHTLITRSTALQTHMFLRSGLAASEATQVELNPWLDEVVKCINYKREMIRCTRYKDQKLSTTHTAAMPYSILARPECSLRKTLLLQNPMKNGRLGLIMQLCRKNMPSAKRRRSRFYDEGPELTLGIVAGMIEDSLERFERSEGWVCESFAAYSVQDDDDGKREWFDKICTSHRTIWAQKNPGRYEGGLPGGVLPPKVSSGRSGLTGPAKYRRPSVGIRRRARKT
ncbi:hypothetical protein LTR56_011631 [Elasticomyces elasticus]|nr:hypothetical protein LTR56_011631 [Elasticomyces elasticus]KAK3647962.1 hypothetical protein LTR22_013575 [Elasticomyces elasticus]KAK4905333.1 hypothetical protein LTR49_025356 [Elasticomyces elasticus]KAK5765335.1 hypothetical protein LTS12_004592 [Elasticomyces elasticus]